MPFSIGGYTIPSPSYDWGISEKFGGNTQSLNTQSQNQNIGNRTTTSLMKQGSPVQGPGLGYYPAERGSNGINTSQGSILGVSNSPSSGGSSGGNNGGGDSGGNDDSMMKAIESAYDDAMGYIGNARDRLNASRGDLMKIATSPYEQMLPQIQQATQEGVGKLQGYTQDTYKQGQNAYDEARRLSSELNQRNLSQFGSGALSSAGQAASELLNRDTFRQFGQIGSGIADTVQGLQRQIFDLEEKSKAQIQSVNMQMEQAKAQAEIEFRNQLSALDEEERRTKQNKSQAKLSELQNLRDYVREIDRWGKQATSQISNQASLNAQDLYTAFSNFQNQAGENVMGGQSAFNSANEQFNGVGDRMSFNNAMGMGPANSNPLMSMYGRYGNNQDEQYLD